MSHIYNQGALSPFSDLFVQACLSRWLNFSYLILDDVLQIVESWETKKFTL
jgi:hypothetical protein